MRYRADRSLAVSAISVNDVSLVIPGIVADEAANASSYTATANEA